MSKFFLKDGVWVMCVKFEGLRNHVMNRIRGMGVGITIPSMSLSSFVFSRCNLVKFTCTKRIFVFYHDNNIVGISDGIDDECFTDLFKAVFYYISFSHTFYLTVAICEL